MGNRQPATGQCYWLSVESVLSVWPVWDCMNLNIMHCSIWADTGEKPKKRNQCECSGSCFQRKLFIRAKSKDCLLISGRDQQRGKTWVPKGTFLSAQTSKQIKAKSKSLSTKPLLPFAVRDALKNCFLGIVPNSVDPPPPVHLGIKMRILAKKVGFSKPKTTATKISHKV